MSVLSRFLILFLVWLGVAGQANPPELESWEVIQKSEGGEIYKKGRAVVLIMGPVVATNIPENELINLSKSFSKECPNFERAPVRPIFSGRGREMVATTGGGRCRLIAVVQNGKRVVAVSLAQTVEGTDHDAVLDRSVARRLGLPMPRPSTAPAAQQRPRPAPAPVQASAQAGDGPLIDYVSRIPASRRPVTVSLLGRTEFSGFPATPVYRITVYLFFANGYATDCADWDPAIFEPTPQSLGKARSDCSLYRWRRNKGALEKQWDDGSWGGEFTGDSAPFRRGERLNIAFGNVRSMSVAGPVSVGTMSGGDLLMRPDGQFATGSWSSTTVLGSNVAGNSSSNGGRVVGRYYIDGYIIAVKDQNGRISAGFILGVQGKDKLSHVYLNGTHFWDNDD